MKKTVRWLSLFLGMSAAGCGGPRMLNEHLLLYIDSRMMQIKTAPADLKPLPFNVTVHSLTLPALYDNADILIRTGDYTVKYSKRASWAVRPNLMATDLLAGFLKKNLPVKAVNEGKSIDSPDFTIDGELRLIEEDLRSGNRKAALAIVLWVKREHRGDKLFFEKRYEGIRDCPNASYAALAEQWSAILLDQFKQFTADFTELLKRETVTPVPAEPKADE